MGSETWLVTGVAGYLGSYVGERLLEEGVQVVGVDNLSWGHQQNVDMLATNKNFIVAKADITNKQQIEEIFKKYRPSKVIHLAALHFIPAAINDPTLAVRINVLGTQTLLSQCLENGCESFWFASTGDVYAPSESAHLETSKISPNNIYGLSKWMGERLIELESKRYPQVKFIIGRLFNLYGARETNPHILPEIIQQLKKQKAQSTLSLKLGNIWPKRDFVPVREASHAVIDMVKKSSLSLNIVNVATGKAQSVEELIQHTEAILGKKIEIEQDPTKIRNVERPHLEANVHKLKELIGWTPSPDCQNNLKELLHYEGLI